MNNKQIAETLERMADALEILGEVPFKTNAYRNAARHIENLSEDVADIYARGALTDVPGIGKALSEKIGEMVTTGHSDYLEELHSSVPPGLLDLLTVPGLGPKRARALHEALGISTLADLETSAKTGRLADVPGFGAKTAESILKNLGRMKKWSDRRILADVDPVANDLLKGLRSVPGVNRADMGGSVRRRRDTVRDLDLLATGPNLAAIIDGFVKLPFVQEVEAKGDTKAVIRLHNDMSCDLRVVDNDSYGAAWMTVTGSEAHSIRLREMAQVKGWKLNEYGIFDMSETKLAGATEEDMYEKMGMSWIPPELREDRGEIEAAMKGKLPVLVTVKDLKADLHMHSRYSDGSVSIQQMARACMERNYRYMAITDHSQGLEVANGLTPERLVEQAEEVRRLNAEFAPFRILCGNEVNIRADGSMDYPDEVLAKLDWVIGSVHGSFGKTREEQTERVIQAMKNPYVNMIAHPTGRIINRREGIDVDMDALIHAARETGTALEINSGPDRLDLDEIHARAAKDAGVWLLVNADAHHPDHLNWVDLGIGQARRAWVEKKNVLNCQPIETVLEFVARKRAG